MNDSALSTVSANGPHSAVMAALLKQAGLPTADLWDGKTEYFVLGKDKAFGGLSVLSNSALLRSIIVSPESRKRGLGTTMVARLIDEAQARGVKNLWLLTTDAAPFFERRGFREAARNEAPQDIQETAQFREHCPASATLMLRGLA